MSDPVHISEVMAGYLTHLLELAAKVEGTSGASEKAPTPTGAPNAC